MYCGKYAGLQGGEEDTFCYLAMNMYWETRTLGLPKLPSGMKWERIVCTADNMECRKENAENSMEQEDTVYITVPARSVGLFTAVNKEKV
jgi:hypothetical protein